MTVLSRDKLLKVKAEVPTEKISVPELGGEVIIRGMTGKEQTIFNRSVVKKGGDRNEVDDELFASKLIVQCLTDEKGERLLKEDEFAIVQGWPASVFQKLAQASLRVNGLISGN
jgi:hypothetical protein